MDIKSCEITITVAPFVLKDPSSVKKLRAIDKLYNQAVNKIMKLLDTYMLRGSN